MRSVKAVEPVAGPSKSPRLRLKDALKGKRKTKPTHEVDEFGPDDEERFMCHRRIVGRIVDKKVEIKMLWKEIEVLEGMLEE